MQTAIVTLSQHLFLLLIVFSVQTIHASEPLAEDSSERIPPFAQVQAALDGDTNAIELIRPCANVMYECAMVLGSAYQRTGEFEQAAHYFAEAAKLGRSTIYLVAAGTYAQIGRPEQAYVFALAYLQSSESGRFALEHENANDPAVRLLLQSAEQLDADRIDAARQQALLIRERSQQQPRNPSLRTSPTLVETVDPKFPQKTTTQVEPGWSYTAINIGPQGEVLDAITLAASHAWLGKAAQDAMRQWRFEPLDDDTEFSGRRWHIWPLLLNTKPEPDSSVYRATYDGTRVDEQGWLRFDGDMGHIKWSVLINEQPAVAMLDTGAGLTAMTRAAAARIGIDFGPKPGPRLRISGVYGEEIVPFTDRFTLQFANTTIPLDRIAVIPGWVGNDIILGRQIFENTVVQIDYPNQRIRFLDRDVIDFEGNLRVRLSESGAPFVRMQVNNKIGWLLFDTGNAGSTLFTEQFVLRHRLQRYEIEDLSLQSQGAIRSGENRVLQIPKVTLGPYPFEPFLARYIPERSGGLNRRQQQWGSRLQSSDWGDGLVGYEVLQHFVVTMDLSERKIHLHLP